MLNNAAAGAERATAVLGNERSLNCGALAAHLGLCSSLPRWCLLSNGCA